ncbi:acetylornithine transaminase [Saccharopolyspora rectivirgula]|jgi:acetylornithine/N-succinyldiaminopimelate aminotransferase|uniref:Acetylornithine aminotransferase n=3 Tax=Saccharopolyspora rectivirgula TaxID=28042 RepID=A0A073AVG4_9PSEU|nr:acetylornithine transaminase [Saccharopolyspora rectivirgula]KEI43778.1 acetylornithine aminotransferase [Saccharopolyspora rectivirgula]
MNDNSTGSQRWQKSMMDNYGTPKLTLVSGSGCEVTDADGRTYLDFLGGIAVNALGHAHPAVVQAVSQQIAKLGHVSNFYAHEPGLELAERLLEITGLTDQARVLFANSGAEANEAAFKIARLTGRTKVVAAHNGFHGRTMGALALTGQPAKQRPFEPLTPGVVHVPYGDVAALESAVDDNTAAVFLEPIQGEAGIVVPPEGYLQQAREITSRNGALLVVDEVQTGIGRTGAWCAFQHSGITPDLITLAKGLGGGLPIGACIGVGSVGDLLQPGQHGTTFGGNPVACAAALAVLDTIARENLLEHVQQIGKELSTGLQQLNHPLISEVRGAGLLLGVRLAEPVAAQVAAAAQQAGYLVNPVQPDTIRLAPPLVVESGQIQRWLHDFPAILDTQEVTS